MWKVLGWIAGLPLGKVMDYFNKKQDIDLEKYKVDGTVDITLIQAEVAITQARAAAQANLKTAHYLFIIPTAVYYSAVVFDCLTEKLLPNWHWDVMPLKGAADIWGGAVISFLFLYSSFKLFRR
jgi:hypothetical protein